MVFSNVSAVKQRLGETMDVQIGGLNIRIEPSKRRNGRAYIGIDFKFMQHYQAKSWVALGCTGHISVFEKQEEPFLQGNDSYERRARLAKMEFMLYLLENGPCGNVFRLEGRQSETGNIMLHILTDSDNLFLQMLDRLRSTFELRSAGEFHVTLQNVRGFYEDSRHPLTEDDVCGRFKYYYNGIKQTWDASSNTRDNYLRHLHSLKERGVIDGTEIQIRIYQYYAIAFDNVFGQCIRSLALLGEAFPGSVWL